MQQIQQTIEGLSKDFSNHPIVGAVIAICHLLGAWIIGFFTTVYGWHIPPIFIEILQSVAYVGAITVSGLTIYPPLKKKILKILRRNG